jgi:hypothetical protein
MPTASAEAKAKRRINPEQTGCQPNVLKKFMHGA